MRRTIYYALYFERTEVDAQPVGLLRERFDESGRPDKAEALGRDGEWQYTNILLSLRRGDQTFDQVAIDATDAAEIERYIRKQLGLAPAPSSV